MKFKVLGLGLTDWGLGFQEITLIDYRMEVSTGSGSITNRRALAVPTLKSRTI